MPSSAWFRRVLFRSDRKSTRLNSSHTINSYAVFCLKKQAGATVAGIAQSYERGGAAALEVLTEGPPFAGTLRALEEARAATSLLFLQKNGTPEAYHLSPAAAASA